MIRFPKFPAEQFAITIAFRYSGGLVIFTIIHPREAPNRNVRKTLIGMNHMIGKMETTNGQFRG
eukprot:Gb_20664 [translate_table: standard]